MHEIATTLGADLLSLVTYITAWPDATRDEMAVFIYNEGGDFYSRQRISQRLAELDIKRGLLLKATRRNNWTFSFECGDSEIAPPPLAFFRCHEGGSLT